MDAQEVATVDTWHRLLNSGDIEQLMSFIHRDIDVGGPRGMSRGVQTFREWFGRAGVQLIPIRYFHKDKVVVVEEEGIWRSPDNGGEAGRQVVASLFEVDTGLITRIKRFDVLATALEEAGLNESHDVT